MCKNFLMDLTALRGWVLFAKVVSTTQPWRSSHKETTVITKNRLKIMTLNKDNGSIADKLIAIHVEFFNTLELFLQNLGLCLLKVTKFCYKYVCYKTKDYSHSFALWLFVHFSYKSSRYWKLLGFIMLNFNHFFLSSEINLFRDAECI